jgi:bacterioferritin-associated ferredoxin
MSDFRCTTCGGVTQAVIKSPVAANLDASYTQVDRRYAIQWCNWCRRTRESIRADSVKEAVQMTRTTRRTTKDPPDQIKGGW